MTSIEEQVNLLTKIGDGKKGEEQLRMSMDDWDTFDAAIATLSSVALVGESKIKYAAEAFELLEKISNGKMNYIEGPGMWRDVSDLLSKINAKP